MSERTRDQGAATSIFEQIKLIDPDGQEYWSARDLMNALGYSEYHKFKPVLSKGQIACEGSGHDSRIHFIRATKMIPIGNDVKREVEDVHLSRYACYLVIQNADPSKSVVALGQTYFAVQTHRQELADAQQTPTISEDEHRLILRDRIRTQNIDLASAAKNAGVVSPQDFAVFQNHGYRGLYNGLTAEDIRKRKKLRKNQAILDHMGSTELAANLFRSTQAEEKLRRDKVQGRDNANEVHHQAGVIVRRAIAELGGTMPENLPTPEDIKKLQQEAKRAKPLK
jgi:DNA-damage-inducible protein D